MMKLRKTFSFLCMIYITLQPVFWAQKLEVFSQVTEYVSNDVTLPCSFNQGEMKSNVTLSQWEFLSPHGNKTLIMVSSKQHGKTVHESHLKGRVDMEDQSLKIKNVELSDAGSYICTISTFPLGPFHETTKLHVQELKQKSSWFIYVIAPLVLLLILSVTAYFFCRRRDCTNRGDEDKQVNARTSGTGFATTAREEEVVYSGVKSKKTTHASSSSNTRHGDSAHSDNVIYSQVNVFDQQSE